MNLSADDNVVDGKGATRINFCRMREMDLQPPFAWMFDKPDTLRHHLENDTGSAFNYTRNRRRELGKRLLALRRIYLDTKYWLYARDVYMKRPQKPIHVQIVQELRRLRYSGTTLCLPSYSVFDELLFQSDSVTRRATAEMIDELSDDCTIQPLFELFKAELYYFYVRTTQPEVSLRPIAELAWTKAAFVVGDMFCDASESGFPEHVREAITKAMDDMLWETKLSEVIDASPPPASESDELVAQAKVMTDGKLEHARPDDSFRKLFLDEVVGSVDGLSDIIGDFLVHIAKENGINETVSEDQKLNFGQKFGRLIGGAFGNGRITNEFPTIGVPAALHAAVRIDPNRKYRKGDSQDFFHAATALGYYNVFLTEASLKHLLQSKDVRSVSNYGCVVLSDDNEILDYLVALD